MGEHGGNKQPVFHTRPQVKPVRDWRTWLIGRPLQTADAPHETIGKLVGLAVFASDALSSTAYATQEILLILSAAGSAAFGLAFPISLAIVALLVIVVVSYQQTIQTYPGGGGAYIVARENIGERAAKAAGAALLLDYILTVSVSVSSGVAQVISAVPGLSEYRVQMALVVVALITLVNLRGVRESGMAFAIPAYLFLISMLGMVSIGLVRYFTGSLGVVIDPPELHVTQGPLQVVSAFLILHAFSSGTSAMTGIEAIANGVTAFKEPRSRNAGTVLNWMGVILSILFLGITFLATRIAAVPSEQETVISQLARTVYNNQGFLYLVTMTLTSLILFMAANTAFAGFPRLAAILAEDNFLPRQFTYRGSRLVYSTGIVALAIIACLLIVLFNASVSRLIPLYAIGVFLSFTLSQVGMGLRWRKVGRLQAGEERVEAHSVLRPDPNWRTKMIVNLGGAVATGIVTLVFAVTKFPDGAYIVILLIPVIMVLFTVIHRHYARLAGRLSLEHFRDLPRISRHRVIVPISGVHQGTLAGLRYATSFSSDVTALYISMEEDATEKIKRKWELYGEGVRLVVVDSPYRLLIEPLLDYIEGLTLIRQPNEVITVVVPQFVSKHWWSGILHSQTAFILRLALLLKPGVVIVEVPYQVD